MVCEVIMWIVSRCSCAGKHLTVMRIHNVCADTPNMDSKMRARNAVLQTVDLRLLVSVLEPMVHAQATNSSTHTRFEEAREGLCWSLARAATTMCR
jgi:hypothetical protein